MTVEYLDLADYVAIAAEVTGLDLDVVMKVANLDLADSALHAPAAGFGDEDFSHTSSTRLRCSSSGWRKNHPLPDGNKRAAWVSLRLFVELNRWSWEPKPGIDDAERAVLAVASGEWDEIATAAWLRRHLRSPG